MRILTIQNRIFYIAYLSILSLKLSAQEAKINIQQNPKFEQLLNEKRKINSSIAVNERYKIQVFSGVSEKAKKTLSDCKQNFADLDETIVFNTPNYKVWIGNFKSRIEAERNLVEIKKVYENAFLIKPKK
ncbi:SPOR domain-containing protein [Flavobacterium undicola]|uniref:SPOR domain-containing protein n=1 Tax=Flavobacterium undicola TaxID=1932779 RepID=UPI00137890FD|nr:SPOR domain-containing protein [Flavobacterium undicola]MBA0882782.1 SPOR domain-containing protein [Flavobacterium undicola]